MRAIVDAPLIRWPFVGSEEAARLAIDVRADGDPAEGGDAREDLVHPQLGALETVAPRLGRETDRAQHLAHRVEVDLLRKDRQAVAAARRDLRAGQDR